MGRGRLGGALVVAVALLVGWVLLGGNGGVLGVLARPHAVEVVDPPLRFEVPAGWEARDWQVRDRLAAAEDEAVRAQARSFGLSTDEYLTRLKETTYLTVMGQPEHGYRPVITVERTRFRHLPSPVEVEAHLRQQRATPAPATLRSGAAGDHLVATTYTYPFGEGTVHAQILFVETGGEVVTVTVTGTSPGTVRRAGQRVLDSLSTS
jgi:hypothetical protein